MIKQFVFSISLFFQVFIYFLWYFIESFNYCYNFCFSFFFFSFDLYIDPLSLLFLFLTVFIMNCCFIFNWNSRSSYQNSYYISLLSVELILFFIFTTVNLLLFYIFFEFILIPFFLLIGLVGYNKRKIHASFLLFFYTFFGSLFMLLGIVFFFVQKGSFSSFDLINHSIPLEHQYYLWWCFFISFAIKIPVFPFHLWLPEAHVEAPTEGSVILAGILLKLGTYGLCRFLFFIFPQCSYYYSNIVLLLCSIGVVYTSLMAIRQIDIKKIIAYSSVAHMNFCTIGLFSFNTYSLQGCIFMMLGHGFVSSALFFLIGIIYNRYHTKLIYHYSGLCYTMPFYYFFFFIFMFSNISFPMTVNFVSEMLILIGVYINNYLVCFFLMMISLFLGAIYNLYMFNHIFFGIPNKRTNVRMFDLTLEESLVCFFLLFFNLLLGVYPSFFLNWL